MLGFNARVGAWEPRQWRDIVVGVPCPQLLQLITAQHGIFSEGTRARPASPPAATLVAAAADAGHDAAAGLGCLGRVLSV